MPILHLSNQRSDSASSPINIQNGLPFGDRVHTIAYVGSNGVISFGRPWLFWFSELFPTNNFFTRRAYVVAPFWSDHDIRNEGSISYQVHQLGREPNSPSARLLQRVSSFVNHQTGADFSGQWMLLVQWTQVHPFPHGNTGALSPSVQEFVEKTNTYQALVITDGVQSYTVFTYNCEMMEWSGFLNRHAVVGYSAFGSEFENHPLSGTPDILEIACDNQPYTSWANQVYRLPSISADEQQLLRRECMLLSSNDVTDQASIQTIASFVQPCPCSIFQAFRDRRFAFDFSNTISRDFSSFCFVQRFPSFVFSDNILFARQLCCYSLVNFGALLTSALEGGNLLLFGNGRGLTEELRFKTTCCAVGLCDLFYQQRPSDHCFRYFPPRFTWGWGDPHITTLDGRLYTFNGWGEYTLTKVPLSQQNGTFVLQGRTQPVENSTATQFSAFAFGDPNSPYIQISYENNEFVVLHNGDDVSANVSTVNDTYSLADVEIFREAENSVVTVFPYDASVTVEVAAGLPNFVLTLPQSLQGETQGLLGNFNGNTTDDLVYPDGVTMLGNNATDSMIHTFGQQWEIQPSESLFTYPEGLTAADFSHPDHQPAFLDEVLSSASDTITQACNNDPQCIFDYAETGDPEVGMATLETNENNNMDLMVTLNNPPVISGTDAFRVNVGEESVYVFNVTDEGDTFNVTFIGEFPVGSTLDRDSSTLYTFRWTLESPENATLEFSAVDSLGAGAMLSPRVEICGCENGGTCTFDGIQNLDSSSIVLNCECPQAWEGRFCEEDANGCAETSCYEGVECMDIMAPGVGAMCGPCPMGLEGDGIKCTDIDECGMSTTHNCEQICINTEGSFLCACEVGYSPVDNSSNLCQDINECEGINSCQQTCTNTQGSFTCSCVPGFELLPDNSSCRVLEMFECPDDNICSQDCILINGTEECSCDNGYVLDDDNMTCNDVNECQQNPCQQVCTNTIGSFTCACNTGYRLNDNGIACDDINECLEAVVERQVLCQMPQLCQNTLGSFSCICPPGTIVVNNTCVEEVIPSPTIIVVALPPTTSIAASTTPTLATATPVVTPTGTAEPIPTVALNNALTVTLASYTPENFTVSVQEEFQSVTAMVVNDYCSQNMEECSTVAITRKRRQAVQIQPSDVIIRNIISNSQGLLEFLMYVQAVGGSQVLAVGALESAVETGAITYEAANFIATFERAVTGPSPSPPGDELSQDEIAGIIIGSVVGGLLIIVISFALFFWCRRRHVSKKKLQDSPALTYGVYRTEEGDYFVARNEAAEETHSVQSMKLTFAPDSSSESSADFHIKESEPEEVTAL